MADVVVTALTSEQAAAQLKLIVDEFGNMKKTWDDGNVWGHPTLRDAMNDFVDDWWVKRAKLLEQLGDLQKKMEQMNKTWDDLEVELTKSLTPEDKPAQGGTS